MWLTPLLYGARSPCSAQHTWANCSRVNRSARTLGSRPSSWSSTSARLEDWQNGARLVRSTLRLSRNPARTCDAHDAGVFFFGEGERDWGCNFLSFPCWQTHICQARQHESPGGGIWTPGVPAWRFRRRRLAACLPFPPNRHQRQGPSQPTPVPPAPLVRRIRGKARPDVPPAPTGRAARWPRSPLEEAGTRLWGS